MPDFNDLLQQQVTNQLHGAFVPGEPVDLVTKQNLDPFGSLNEVPPNTLGGYNFGQVQPNQCADFFTRMNLLGQQNVPQPGQIPPNALVGDVNKVHAGIPRLQHSVWVGEPLNGLNTQLNAPNPKKLAFMNQLVQNKLNNPHWEVVLWTDQPRSKFHDVLPDPDIADMKLWAQNNGIKLASIDEIFGDPANRMKLHTICKLEANKGGTGRAAVSDIVRLEVLSRFGGLYVDGDKPFLTPLDNVLTQASQSQIDLQGQIHSGFLSANESGTPQNCALISQKDSPVVNGIIDHIGGVYAKDRVAMQSGGNPIQSQGRPQRVEIIARTGPTAIKSITQGMGLMNPDHLQSYTGTTSWSQEEPHTGYKILNNHNQLNVANVGRFDANAQNLVLANGAVLPVLPNTDNLTQQQLQRIGTAVRNSLTSLSYTVTNENGRLDLKHLLPHISGNKLADDDERRIATHAIITALGSPQFTGLAGKIKEVAVPPQMVGITAQSMDLLRDTDLFPHAKLDTYCVQRAALRGDLAMLNYCKTNAVSFTTNASSRIDAGMAGDLQSSTYTPLGAAVRGGNVDALKFVLAETQRQLVTLPLDDEQRAAVLNDRRAALETAGTMGQTEMMLLITDVATTHALTLGEPDRTNELDAIAKSINTANENLGNTNSLKQRVPITDACKIFTNYIPDGAKGDKYRDLANGVGLLTEYDEQQLEQLIKTELSMPSKELGTLRNLVNPPSYQNGIIHAINVGGFEKNNRDLLVTQVRNFGSTNFTAKLDNTPALLGVSEVAKMNQDLGNWILQQGDENAALLRATQLGVENNLLNYAAEQGNTRMLTHSLNGQRLPGDQVTVGDFDLEAEIAVAHKLFPNSETNKNAYKQINANNANTFTADQVRKLARQALVYGHDRLRADSKGKNSRVEGWAEALDLLSNQNPHMNDPALKSLVDEARLQVQGVNAHHSIRDVMRQQAKDYGGPQLSQREGTSTLGRIRDAIKKPAAPPPLPQPHVPGKRV